MQLTAVMITRNRCAQAVTAVRRLRALPERPEVIVVDNGSTDGTAATLDRLPGVRVIAAGRNLGAAGRTLGARAAATPYVAFTDDDSWWAPGALALIGDLFDSYPRLALVTGRTVVEPDGRDDPINAELAAAPLGSDADLPGPLALGFLACAAAVRREAFLAVGGFHPRFGVGGEEQLLAIDLLAAGWGTAYVPQIGVHHAPVPDGSRAARPVTQQRNELWTAWLRRRPATVALTTRELLRGAVRDATARRVLGAALRGTPWVLRERRAISPALERSVRRVEAAARAGSAGAAR